MGQFAYDLHSFVVSKGGGFDNYMKQVAVLSSNAPKNAQDPVNAKAMELLSQDMAKRDALDKTHVSFAQQKIFAKIWWTDHSDEFKKTNGLMQDWWLNDSIIDANNLWSLYMGPITSEEKDKSRWIDYEMQAVVQKH